MKAVFGSGHQPVMLAPLAGVSDAPFRRVCQMTGADLTYVEMLSATALLYENKKTFHMCYRHPDEEILGVQLTGRNADEVASAIEVLERFPFDTVDINMGCPVQKVVKKQCGSAILLDPERVYETVKKAVQATDRPVSAKIRLGWNRELPKRHLEIADAVEKGGAVWLTVHGRYRSDKYETPVDLGAIGEIKESVAIPLIGNGNLFHKADLTQMHRYSGVDGWMVARGALGNPWVFCREQSESQSQGIPHIDEWCQLVKSHISLQRECYGDAAVAAICMRKHLLWYFKGWPGAKRFKLEVNQMEKLSDAFEIVDAFYRFYVSDNLENLDHKLDADSAAVTPMWRAGLGEREADQAFVWDPKYDMDRGEDAGVGHL